MLSLGDLWSALAGVPVDGEPARRPLTSVTIDSRQAIPGSLFVALQGEKQDGHDFVADAFRRGAVAALVSRPVGDCGTTVRVQGPFPVCGLDGPVCLQVPDVLRALQDLAASWRRRHGRCRAIAVTGSLGKTSTKEAVAAVLSQRFPLLKSEGNYNNEIGLPLTLLQLDDGHERAVLEMAMYAPGEIARLVEIASPAVGVVTNVGPVHLERLGSLEAIARAKAELPQGLPADGVLVLNGDDPRVLAMAQQSAARMVLTYGLGERCDLRACRVRGRGLAGIEISLDYRGWKGELSLPWLGRHNVYAALAAVAVGFAEGMRWEEISAGLTSCSSLGRLRVLPGPGGVMVLDDTYNASPASTLADLDFLTELPGRHLAVLGDMLELGSYEEEGHREVGRRAGQVLSLLATVGKRAHWIAEEAQRVNPQLIVWSGQDPVAATEWLRPYLSAGDYVLVKASRALALEKVVRALCEEGM